MMMKIAIVSPPGRLRRMSGSRMMAPKTRMATPDSHQPGDSVPPLVEQPRPLDRAHDLAPEALIGGGVRRGIVPDPVPELVQRARAVLEHPTDDGEHRLLVIAVAGRLVGELEDQVGDRLGAEPAPGLPLHLRRGRLDRSLPDQVEQGGGELLLGHRTLGDERTHLGGLELGRRLLLVLPVIVDPGLPAEREVDGATEPGGETEGQHGPPDDPGPGGSRLVGGLLGELIFLGDDLLQAIAGDHGCPGRGVEQRGRHHDSHLDPSIRGDTSRLQ
jgi:hypothetical protein